MLADVLHQAADDEQAHQEADDAAHKENHGLVAGHGGAGLDEFQGFQAAGPHHGGDGHEEGELRCRRTADPQKNCPQDGGTGPGGAGDQTQTLKAADEQGGLVVDFAHLLDDGLLVGVAPLHQNEGNAVGNEGDGHGDVMIKVCFHPVIQQNPQNAGGEDGHDDLGPQVPGGPLLGRGFFRAEWVQALEEQHNDRQDGPQLNDHLEHGVKFIADAELHELVQQNEVAGGGNGQPFGDALHDAKKNGFENFKHGVAPLQIDWMYGMGCTLDFECRGAGAVCAYDTLSRRELQYPICRSQIAP